MAEIGVYIITYIILEKEYDGNSISYIVWSFELQWKIQESLAQLKNLKLRFLQILLYIIYLRFKIPE